MKNIYNEICNDVLNNRNITIITGGLKNKSYLYRYGKQKFFVKVYNPKTKFSRHMNVSRCACEYQINNYLYKYECAVAKPLYYDEEKQIGIYEYIEGVNLYSYKKFNKFFYYDVINQIAKIHSVPVVNELNGCVFNNIDKDDIYRYIIDGINFLIEIFGIRDIDLDFQLYTDIACEIDTENKIIGNTQLHNGNIMVANDNKIYLCDFEKVCPHYPQMDIMSFLNCRNLSVEKEIELIKYYISIKQIKDTKKFIMIYNLLYIIDCLRVIKKIKYNLDGYEVKWVEKDGKRQKKYEKSNSNAGEVWNRERNESIDMRIQKIMTNIYSNDTLNTKFRMHIQHILERVCK